MPSEDYTLREVDDVLVVEIEADNLLNVNEVSRIGEMLNELVKDSSPLMVMNLAKVRYAGSAALGMLMSLMKKLQGQGGRLILAGTQHLDLLFKVSRIVAMFEVAVDVPSAVQTIKN
ncbi:MAG TPA: STAS domain-containing protein [Tepidisphaeraceae bacterium]|jgi:anti-anti-sigma factor|nr:STAS domain-containing protein [Tepidisphaeraceae bacterium]